MSFSFSSDLNAPLKIRPVDAWGPLQDYWNIQRSQADVGYTQAQTDYTKANTIKQQIDNELQRLQYGYQRAGWDIGSNKTGWQLPAPPQWPTPPDRVAPQKPQQGQQPDFSGGFGDETGGAQQPAATPPARQQQSQQQPAAPISPTTGKPMPLSGGSDQAALPTPPIPPGYDPTTGTRLAQGSDGNVYRVPAQPNQLAQMQPPGGGPPQQPGILGRYPGSYQTASLGQTPPPQGQGGGEQPIPPGVMQQAAQGATPAAAPTPQQPPPTQQRPAQAPPGRQQQPENTGIVHIPDPPPGSGPPNPWARTDPSGTNGIDTSSLGLGVPTMPTMLGIAALRDPKAAAEALNMRKQALANAAAGATDLASWNRGVKSLDDQGWITHGEAAHYWNHPAYKETVLRQAMSADAQSQLDQNLYGHGMESGPYSHPRPSATVAQSEAQVTASNEAARRQFAVETIKLPNPDGTFTTVQVRGDQVPDFYRQHQGATRATAADVNFNPRDVTYQPALAAVPPQYREMVRMAAQQANVPLGMLVSTINVESAWDPSRTGSKGEIGLGQVLPETGRAMNYTPDQLRDPATNLLASAQYLRTMLDQQNGNIPLAAARYNGVNNPDYINKWLTDYSRWGTYVVPAGAQVPAPGQQSRGGGGIGIPGPTELSKPNEKRVEEGTARIGKDNDEVTDRLKASKDSLAQQVQMQVLEPLIDQAGPGAFGRAQMAAANFLKTYAPEGFADGWLGQFAKGVAGIDPNRADAMQELAKLTLSIAGSSAGQTAGHNTGLGIVQLYQHSFPGLDTSPTAFKNMLHLFEVAHQSQIDYSSQSNDHYIGARHEFLGANGAVPYRGLNEFDADWQDQKGIHAPQVYVAAAAILNGVPEAQWKAQAGLDRAQQVEAIKIAMRANPQGTRAYTDPETGKISMVPLKAAQQ